MVWISTGNLQAKLGLFTQRELLTQKHWAQKRTWNWIFVWQVSLSWISVFFFQIFYLLTLAKEKSFAFLLLSIQVQICFSANFCRFLNCLVQRQGWTGYFNLVRLTNLSANRRPFRPHSFKKFSLTSGFIQIVFCRFWWLRTHFFSCSKILVLKWKFIFPVKIFYSGFDSSLWCLIKNKDM